MKQLLTLLVVIGGVTPINGILAIYAAGRGWTEVLWACAAWGLLSVVLLVRRYSGNAPGLSEARD